MSTPTTTRRAGRDVRVVLRACAVLGTLLLLTAAVITFFATDAGLLFGAALVGVALLCASSCVPGLPRNLANALVALGAILVCSFLVRTLIATATGGSDEWELERIAAMMASCGLLLAIAATTITSWKRVG